LSVPPTVASSSSLPERAGVRVFNVNKAIGYASSGVEYAQKYRREVFAGIEWVEDYYLFTDYLATNICVFTDRLGFARRQMLWIYNLVTGRATAPSTLSVERLIAGFRRPYSLVAAPAGQTSVGQTSAGQTSVGQAPAGRIDIALTDSAVRYRIWTLDDGGVDRVEMLVGDQVVRVEHYDDSLNNVEHFHDNRLVRRVFYTRDGRVGAEQFYQDREIIRTLITPASPLYHQQVGRGRRGPRSPRGDMILDGRSQFFQFVLERLLGRPDDVVIVDRALDVIDGIYPVIGDHRLYSVVHAEHFDLGHAGDGVLLWNNHYENVFTRPEMIDGFIVSTNRQREVLERQLASLGRAHDCAVTCIPAGFAAVSSLTSACANTDVQLPPMPDVQPLVRPDVRTPPGAYVQQSPGPNPPLDYHRFAVITASRLAAEKHLDILIRAVALARAQVPELRLDIYGEGNRDRLLAVIRQTHTEDCVRLMGHQNLAGVLSRYGLYASASTSEGFGLSLVEALAAGLPIVGFDVDYGNRELIEPGVNGRLVPRSLGDGGVAGFAAAIVDVLTSPDLDDMRRASLRKAQAYSIAHMRELWAQLLREESAC
jgi:glycosyltransferase involved in cell wall biosynthesis